MPYTGSSSLSIINESFSSQCSILVTKTEQRERQRQGVDDRDPVSETLWKWQQAHSRMATMLMYVCSVPIQSQKEIYHFIHVHGKEFQALPEDLRMKTERVGQVLHFRSEHMQEASPLHRAVLHLFFPIFVQIVSYICILLFQFCRMSGVCNRNFIQPNSF